MNVPQSSGAPLPGMADVLSIFKRVATPSLAYLGTNVIRAGLPFLLIPFLTKHLSPAEYGIIAFYQALLLFIVPFVPFNVNSAATVEYYKLNREDFSVYLTSSLIPPLLISAALMAIFWLIPASALQKLLVTRSWLFVLPLFGLSQLLPNILLSVYQVQQKPASFGLFTIGLSALNVTLTVFFISGLHWGWQGRLYAILCSQVLFSVFAFFLLRRVAPLRLRISLQYVKDVTRYCLPLIPHAIGASAIDIGDRIIIAAQLGASAVGEYTVAAQISQTLVVFLGSLNQAWTPFLFRELQEITPERKRQVVRATYGVAVVTVAAFGGLVIMAPVVAHTFFDKRYWLSLPLVPWIGAGYLFNGFYYLVCNYIFFAKQTRLLALLTFGNAIVSVCMTYFAVKYFGTPGAAWATTLSWAIFFVGAWVLSNRVLPMPWAIWRPMGVARGDEINIGA